MRLNNIGYLLKEGFKGIFTHGFMSFAAVVVTVACLLIVGSFSILAYNLDIIHWHQDQYSEQYSEGYLRFPSGSTAGFYR